jgi:hypothetical protein
MVDGVLTEWGQIVFARQISGADQPAETLRAGVVWKFSLSLDV